MLGRKRLLSALLAGALSVSSFFAAAPLGFAADDEIEMTFDGLHSMDEFVEYSYFNTANEYEVQEELEEKILKAAGVESIDEITYDDLANVKTLNLSGLELVDVPSCINYMVNMTKLDLSSNLLQSEALKKLSLIGCSKLSNINLSDNYLTTMPSWFVSDRVTSGNITKNFVDSSNPKGIKALLTTYYLMDGETLKEDDLKNQILKSIRLNDGSLLPEIFFDYNSSSPPYPCDDPDDYPYALNFDDWESFTTDGVVVASQNKTIEVTVRLFNETDNDNTKTTVTIYLLSGKDLSSLKKRLESLKAECDILAEDEYTAGSWTEFTRAKDTADAILQYGNADIQMLTSAFNALVNARDNLCYGTKDLQDTLKALITVGGTYKQDDYTPSSWESFSNALERLNTIASDDDAKLETALSAVKEFQRAQANLSSAELSVPDKILKSDFEKIYGEDESITASGVTQAGTSYTWTFYGKDLQEVADFNPEVKDTDANESKILLEAGSSSGYRMFVTSDSKALPGSATLEIDVSDKFTSGKYYLYKWNGTRSQMAGSVTVTDGKAAIPLTEGGVYYLSPKIQNFELKSDTYQVDSDKKKITIRLCDGVTANSFKKSFEFGEYTSVLDADGNVVASNSNVKSGMTINAPNMDKYSILVVGDLNNNGHFDIEDITILIRDYMNAATTGDAEAYDINGDASFKISDISMAIAYYMSA